MVTTSLLKWPTYPGSPLTPRKAPVKPAGKNYNKTVDNLFSCKHVSPEKLLGIEIECEGFNLFHTPVAYWEAYGGEHSLRSFKGGHPYEYILREPASREEAEAALDYLLPRLNRPSTELNLSERCSVHVHLNVQSWKLVQVFTFVCIYIILEDLLVEFCGEHRVGNLFCLRSRDAQNNIKALSRYIQNDVYTELALDTFRYVSLNLAALKKFGSIEFRSMRGTTDKKLILTWIDIILAIREAALKFDDPTDVVTAFESLGPMGFMYWVLGDLGDIFKTAPDCTFRLWEGSRLAREVAFATEWEEAKAIKKKQVARKKRGSK